MADKKSEESFIEKVLRSVLISSKGGVPLQKLNYEFKELLGQDIPYRENGFKTVETYLKTMPSVCQIRRDPKTGETMCMGVANEETQHLDRLVKKQKATKKKSKPARLPKYSGRSGNRPRRPPPQNLRPKPSYYSQQQQNPPRRPTSQPQVRGRPEPFNGPYQKSSGPYQRNSGSKPAPNPQRNDGPRTGPQQRNHSGAGSESWNQKPGNKPVPNPQRHNQGIKHQPKTQHSSSYEVPPRFRRQVHSTGNANDDYQEPSQYNERSKSDSDYPVPGESNNNKYAPEEPPQQPPQPPPVDDKIVSWVSETLAEKTGGLWLSGLKKLYKEKFHTTMEDELIQKLSRLRLWTAEEIGCQSDSILYPNLRLGSTKTLSTASLHSRDTKERQRVSTSVVGNDQILYPNLKVEISQSTLSGKGRRNVTSQPLQAARPPTVPDIIIPEEDCLWEVYVSYIISVAEFYCIIMGDDYADKLCTLEDNMREFYGMDHPDLYLRDLPVEGSLYAAQLDDDWLRVKVIAVGNQEVGCFLVDHGDVEPVPLEDLRVLDPAFYQLAFQAIQCKLHGMDNKETSQTATKRFCNNALGETRLAQVISRDSKPLSLTLYRDRLNINYLCALGDMI